MTIGDTCLKRQIENLIRRIKNVVAIGKIHSVDADYNAQASFLNDETKDKTFIAQHYGFTSKPLQDAMHSEFVLATGNPL